MKKKGQIIDTSTSNGMGVQQFWAHLFLLNEERANDGKEPLTDDEITRAMFVAFPDRKSSQIFYQVNRVRQRYNRGMLTRGEVPLVRSLKYVHYRGEIVSANSLRESKRLKSGRADKE